jgi:hypothetical protein
MESNPRAKVYCHGFNSNPVQFWVVRLICRRETRHVRNWIPGNGRSEPATSTLDSRYLTDQIMATDNSKRQVWEEVLLRNINSQQPQSPYILLKSGQLVGAALCVFVRADYAANIRNVDGAIKKTGLAGLAGNKGGVAIRMDFFDTSLCFVCAHLAAGHSNVDDRNENYRTISQGLTFNKGRAIGDHEVVVWLGDFNYRVNLDYETVVRRAANSEFEGLLKLDQVRTGFEVCC